VVYCYFFAKHALDSILLEIVGRHALTPLSCPYTSDPELSTRMGEACTNCKPKPGLGDLYSYQYERSLRPRQPTWAVSSPVGCYHLRPPSPFIIIIHPKGWYSSSTKGDGL